MNNELADLSPSAVVAALRDSLVAYWSELFSQIPGTAFRLEQGVFCFETEIRHDVFNRGLQTDCDMP
jgi:hypothetical protein